MKKFCYLLKVVSPFAFRWGTLLDLVSIYVCNRNLVSFPAPLPSGHPTDPETTALQCYLYHKSNAHECSDLFWDFLFCST